VTNCQELFSAEDMATSFVIMVKNTNEVNGVKNELSIKLGRGYEVMDWMELNRGLIKYIESDRASNMIVKGILYIIIAFGIFGTVMMMVAERKKEFGILIAIGMQKYKLCYVVVLEVILLGFIGVLTGIVSSIPVTWYFKMHPIAFTGQAADTMLQMGFEPVMAFSMMPSVFYNQAITIFIFTLIISLYPIFNIRGLIINKALRS
jgi:ABC-type lipoprotein release transport system permease subunit